MMQEELFDIPKLLYFESKNIFSGSLGKFSYKIFPAGEMLNANVWYGIYCMDKSEILDSRDFPLTLEGRENMIAWLTEQFHAFEKKGFI